MHENTLQAGELPFGEWEHSGIDPQHFSSQACSAWQAATTLARCTAVLTFTDTSASAPKVPLQSAPSRCRN